MLTLLGRFGDRGLRAFGVTDSALAGEDRQAVLDAIRDEKMPFPTLLDPEAAWSKRAGIEINPTFLVIAKDGSVLARVTGKLMDGGETYATLVAAIERALARQ
ncbi:MAG: hypothetical protein U0441_24290 [Polyangiaceae bacterium]